MSLLGASVSAGFTDPKPNADGEPNSTVKLAYALRPVWEDAPVRVRDRSDLSTFLDPVAKQTRRVDAALGDEPTAVVAIDFLFWFGYGWVRGDERKARLALQQEGLALLERFDVPVLVGDYPDMAGADPRMLSPAQIPDPETLVELNRRLTEWAAKRGNVQVFPLAQFVTDAKGGSVTVPFEDAQVVLGPRQLLQGDKLHATRLGMALLADRVSEQLAAMLPKDHPARPPDLPLVDFAEQARALLTLEEAAEAQRKPTGAGR